MTPEELQAIEERWAATKRQFGARCQDFEDLLAEVRRLNERIGKMKSEACPPVHCPDGVKCSECWDSWMTKVCNEMREKEAAGNG